MPVVVALSWLLGMFPVICTSSSSNHEARAYLLSDSDSEPPCAASAPLLMADDLKQVSTRPEFTGMDHPDTLPPRTLTLQ